jgi:predicted outer membrane repeat protein
VAFIHNSTFLNNRVNLPNHLPAPGGPSSRRTPRHPPPVGLRITNTRFEGNQAGYVGGAIYALGFWTAPESTPKVDLLCTNCTFVNNAAVRDPSVAFAAPAVGGAVHIEDQTTARFFSSRFVTNSARQGGALSNYRAKLEIWAASQGNAATGTGSGEGFGGPPPSCSPTTTRAMQPTTAARGPDRARHPVPGPLRSRRQHGSTGRLPSSAATANVPGA